MHFGTNRIRAHGITLRLEDNATDKQADSGLHRCFMIAGSSLKFNRNLFSEDVSFVNY